MQHTKKKYGLRNILLIFYVTFGFVTVAIGQQYKFKFWDIRSKKIITNIKVDITFEICELDHSYISYDNKVKAFVYHNTTFGTPPKMNGSLYISSDNYCFLDSNLETKNVSIYMRDCVSKPCLFNVLPVTKIVFENSTKDILVIDINLPFDCKTNSGKFAYHTKNTFISSSCITIDSLSSSFCFDLLPKQSESFDLIPRGKIKYVVSDTLQTYKSHGDMDLLLSNYKKVKIK